jgi:UDP-glucuronate decarboxylase
MDPVIAEDVKQYLKSDPPGAFPSHIMVLGASGMLGSYALEFFCEMARVLGQATQVVAASRSETTYLRRLEAHYKGRLKLVSPDVAITVLPSATDWLVIHAASPASPDQYLGNEIGLINTNLTLTINVMEQLTRSGGRLIYFSSGEVYGTSPQLPTREDTFSALDHLGSRGSYGEAKRAGELIVKLYSDQSPQGSSALRIYHTFGPGIDVKQSRIFSSVVNSLVRGTPISLRTDGAARRSFLYSADLMSAVISVSFQNQFDAYNVAGEQELSIREFAEVASGLSDGLSPVILHDGSGTHSKAGIVESPIMRGVADTTRLRDLGWRPVIAVEEAIRRTVASVRWRQTQQLG